MDHIGIDLHKRESQMYILAEVGEVIEQRIRTEGVPASCTRRAVAAQARRRAIATRPPPWPSREAAGRLRSGEIIR